MTLTAKVGKRGQMTLPREVRARYGLAEAVIDREDALCQHTIRQPRGHALVVPDLTRDERFVHSPLVVGAPHARFYAGLAIRSGAGRVVGTLCLMDRVPRDDVSSDRVRILQELALVAEAHSLGLLVVPWTVNDPLAMEKVMALGVDGLITDYPNRLRSVMQAMGMTVPAPTPMK